MRRLSFTLIVAALIGCTDRLDFELAPAADAGDAPGADGSTPEPELDAAADSNLPPLDWDPDNPPPLDAGTKPGEHEPDAQAMNGDEAIVCHEPSDFMFPPETPCARPIRWQRTISNGEPDNSGTEVAVDADGNVYWMMTRFGVVQLAGRAIGDAFSETMLLLSYAPDGTLRWVFDLNNFRGESMAVSDSQVCVAADKLPEDFGATDPLAAYRLDPEHTGYESVVCLGLDGQPRWARDLSALIMRIADLAFDGQGNLIAGGSFQGTLNVSASLSAESRDMTEPGAKDDGFLVSYAADGATRWLTTMGGPRVDEVKLIATYEDGRVAIIGEHAGDFTIGDGPTPDLGPSDDLGGAAFVALFDPAGALLWAVRSPESSFPEETQRPVSLVRDARDRLIVTYEYAYTAVVHDEDGAIVASVTDFPGHAAYSSPGLAASPAGYAAFGNWIDEDSSGALTAIDFDLNAVSRRVLTSRASMLETGVGLGVVAVAPDGALVVASDFGDPLFHHLVVLEP